MTGDLKDFLTKQVKLTGFPLQVEIASLLKNNENKYGVFNNEYYFDSDEQKAREIDIHAFPCEREYYKIQISPFSIHTDLAIECKKSETHAWIFFNQPEGLKSFNGQYIDFMQIQKKDLELGFFDLLSGVLHYDQFSEVATSYTEIVYQDGGRGRTEKSRTEKSEIFEAKNQLTKFISYDFEQLLKRLENRALIPKLTTHYLSWIYYPIIVFDGKLYEATCKNNDVELTERKHILLSAKYSPQYAKNFPKTDSRDMSYLIDVVRRDFFSDFLNILETECLERQNYIHDNLKTLIAEVRERQKISEK